MADFRFVCMYCKGHLLCDEKMSGQNILCPHCSKNIMIPEPHIPDKMDSIAAFTKEQQSDNFSYWKSGMSDMAKWQFPCFELIMMYCGRVEPDWIKRWKKCGGKLYNGRMIALKDDPVWIKLGDSSIFTDAFDNPYPPFSADSGMGFREVNREECIALGIIAEDYEPVYNDPYYQLRLKAEADNIKKKFGSEFLSATCKELDAKIPKPAIES